jgi:hypothetical protein
MATGYTLVTGYTGEGEQGNRGNKGDRGNRAKGKRKASKSRKLGAGAELVALEFEIETAAGEAEFASGAGDVAPMLSQSF